MAAITATIITLDEERKIADCIRSVQQICDEVVVVDSLSRDNTTAIAEKLGARVVKQAYLGDGPQKNHAASVASNDWVLAIDADERPDTDMVELIQKLDLSDPCVAYAFRRKSFLGRRWIRAAGFYPDYKTRLYNRKKAGYLPRKGHSKVEAPRLVRTRAHILHYTYDSYSDWIRTIDRLSSRDAWMFKERGLGRSSLRPLLHAATAAVRKGLFKGGLFQGSDGLTVVAATVFRTYMKYVKLNELYENETGPGGKSRPQDG